MCNVKRDVFACPKMSQFMDSHFPISDAASVTFVKPSLRKLFWSQRCDPGTGLFEHFKGCQGGVIVCPPLCFVCMRVEVFLLQDSCRGSVLYGLEIGLSFRVIWTAECPVASPVNAPAALRIMTRNDRYVRL